jgi:uncharacterized membrane protein YhaH (DUF805 family)
MIVNSAFYKAIILGFKNYFNFKTRASRAEYWLWTAFIPIIMILIGKTGMVGLILWIIVIIPTIFLNVRRLHDVNFRGWWFLINFIPIVGWIWSLYLLYLFCLKGDEKPNRFGKPPQILEITTFDKILLVVMACGIVLVPLLGYVSNIGKNF